MSDNYLGKCSKVFIEGAFLIRKWTVLQGQEKYSTEIVLQKFRGELTMLDGRGEGGGMSDGGGYSSGGGFSSGPRNTSSGPREDFSADLDDEIPF